MNTKGQMNRIERITEILDSKKGEDIAVVDMKSSDYIFDYVIVVTMLNEKHGLSLLDYLKTALKPEGEEFLAVDEGDQWIVVDMGDILIHLMTSEYRKIYEIEDFLKNLEKSKL